MTPIGHGTENNNCTKYTRDWKNTIQVVDEGTQTGSTHPVFIKPCPASLNQPSAEQSSQKIRHQTQAAHG